MNIIILCSFSGTQPATCSGFRAGDARRAVKDKGLAVTGVIAVVCIRHGIFRPAGMVNMYVGERCVNNKHSLSSQDSSTE